MRFPSWSLDRGGWGWGWKWSQRAKLKFRDVIRSHLAILQLQYPGRLGLGERRRLFAVGLKRCVKRLKEEGWAGGDRLWAILSGMKLLSPQALDLLGSFFCYQTTSTGAKLDPGWFFTNFHHWPQWLVPGMGAWPKLDQSEGFAKTFQAWAGGGNPFTYQDPKQLGLTYPHYYI